MDSISIITINKLISLLNTNQQIIANELLININFDIYHQYNNNNIIFLIKDKRTNSTYNFIEYVKSKCNCS